MQGVLEIIQWCIAMLGLLLFGYFVVLNTHMAVLVLARRSRRTGSLLWCLGGVVGSLSILLIPGSNYTKYAWLPLVIDWTIPFAGVLLAGLVLKLALGRIRLDERRAGD
jgi:hypothetical protein